MKKQIRHFLTVLMVVVVLGGCNYSLYNDEEELTTEDIQQASQATFPVETPDKSKEMKAISIYTFDDKEEVIQPININVEQKRITLEFILNKVIENLDVKVGIKEISVDNKKAIIVFDSSGAPIKGTSSTVETLILDCFSNSILDNISYVDSIVFRTDKGAYRSDNMELGKNEIYSSR